MEIEIFHSFYDIPGSDDIMDKIPIFALPIYAEWIFFEKKYKTIWFVKHDTKVPLQIIPFATLKKGPFIKGMFLTEVLNFANDFSFNDEKNFLNDIINIIREKRLCQWVQQSPNWAIFNTYPDKSTYIPYGTYYIDLENNTEEQLFQMIKTHTRGDIRKAESLGVNIVSGKQCLNDLYSLIKNTFRISKMDYPSIDQIDQMVDHFKQNILCMVAYCDEIPQTGAILLLNRFGMYGMYMGTKIHPVRGSTAFMFYQGAFKSGKNLKIHKFDFVGAILNPENGTKDYQIQKFKTSFGPQQKTGYIWKIVISKQYYLFYHLYYKLIRIIRNKRTDLDIIDRVKHKNKNSNNLPDIITN